MTITINPFEILRVLFIFGWLILAGVFTTASLQYADREDKIFLALVWLLCGGSAIMLYLGKT